MLSLSIITICMYLTSCNETENYIYSDQENDFILTVKVPKKIKVKEDFIVETELEYIGNDEVSLEYNTGLIMVLIFNEIENIPNTIHNTIPNTKVAEFRKGDSVKETFTLKKRITGNFYLSVKSFPSKVYLEPIEFGVEN